MSETDAELRRPLERGESLVRCAKCGRVEIPLNEVETWHYARTGEGLGKDCPDRRPIPKCKWERL